MPLAMIAKMLLPALAGPVMTYLTKLLIRATGRSIKPEYLPVLSTAAGAVYGVLQNPAGAMAGDIGQGVMDAVAGAIAGLGGAKGRDLLTGKTRTVTPEEKARLEEPAPAAPGMIE